MANQKWQGSIILKLAIVVLVVALILVILIPGDIWTKEDSAKNSSRNNMTSIYENIVGATLKLLMENVDDELSALKEIEFTYNNVNDKWETTSNYPFNPKAILKAKFNESNDNPTNNAFITFDGGVVSYQVIQESTNNALTNAQLSGAKTLITREGFTALVEISGVSKTQQQTAKLLYEGAQPT